MVASRRDIAQPAAERPEVLAGYGGDSERSGRGRLRGVVSLLSTLATSRNYWLLVLASAVAIGPAMMPVKWSGNEIAYFDLAYRTVQPDAFSDAHAMFDGSNARFASLWFIGMFIQLLGYEMAKTVLALICWALYALGLAGVARGLDLRVSETVAALTVFLLADQELVGREWIFGTVEPKVLAYALVLFGFAAALKQRWAIMVVLTTAATYLHFLVGGAWAVLFLSFLAMQGAAGTRPLRLLGLYVLLVLPLLALLVRERLGVSVDTTGLDGTIDQIYAVFRVAHHVAPYADGLITFGRNWLPGLVAHAGLAAMLLLAASSSEGRDRVLHLWAGVLNLLLLAAAAVAYLDRETHFFAKLLIFRPSSLVLLISCLLLVRRYVPMSATGDRGRALAALVLVSALLLPDYAKSVGEIIMRTPPDARLKAQMTTEQRDLVRWIAANTEESAAILIEQRGGGVRFAGEAFPLGLERLTGRGFIVSFKNVPSGKADFVRWYRLLMATEAFFAGDCAQLEFLGADYVIFRSQEDANALSACTEAIHDSGAFIVAQRIETG